jgi:histidinol-phosphate aminotransferase
MPNDEFSPPNPARAVLDLIRPYEPGKPIEEVQRELGVTDVVKLASNENPLGASPLALEAIRNMISGLNRYPDSHGYLLKSKIGERLGFSRDWIVLGNGSTEIVEQICEAFLDPGNQAITGKEMFFKYPIAIRFMSAEPILVPLANYKLNLDDVLARVTPKTKAVFIANPNNPTGSLIPRQELDKFIEEIPPGVVVVLDEAYSEYLPQGIDPDSLRYVREGRNVIVLRTFSKIYGLAGLRIGYGMAPPHLVAAMNKIREAFNTSSVAQAAALAAMDDYDFVAKTLQHNESGKEYLQTGLEKIGISPVPTFTNFFLVPLPMDGREAFHRLLRRGVIVRPMSGYGLSKAIRVTIGTQDENQKFLTALEDVLS